MSRLLDKAFRYVPSHSTNVARTIERERKRIRDAFNAEKKRSDAVIEEAKRVVAKTKIGAK